MDLKRVYDTYKKIAAGLVIICGLVNAVVLAWFPNDLAGPSHLVLVVALLLLSCALPAVLLARSPKTTVSLAIFVAAMIANGAALGAQDFPANAFAGLAALTSGAAATVVTLLRAEQQPSSSGRGV